MGTLQRTILFQFFFVFAFIKYRDISKSSYEFKDKFYELTTLLNFKNNLIDQAFANPVLVFQAFLGIQVFCALLAILGSRFFSFITGVVLIAANLVYNNPLKFDTKNNFGFFTIPFEFLILTAFTIGVFTQAFSGSSKCKSTNPETSPSEQLNDRGAKQSSYKKKRI